MRIFAPNHVVAKSRFWYFVSQLRKMKKASGETVYCGLVSTSHCFCVGGRYKDQLYNIYGSSNSENCWHISMYRLVVCLSSCLFIGILAASFYCMWCPIYFRSTRRHPWRWRTLASGCVTTPAVEPTTCTESTETWPLLGLLLSAVSVYFFSFLCTSLCLWIYP